MKRIVELQTSEGNKVRIVLDNWGSGIDRTMRRWTLGDGHWRCMDSAEIAQESRWEGPRVFGARNPGERLREVRKAIDQAIRGESTDT